MPAQITVAVMVSKGVELVDMNGPIDVFLHANRFNNSRYNVITVASEQGPVLSENGAVTLLPAYTIDDCPPPDIFVIPGLVNEVADDRMIAWIRGLGAQPSCTIMSVCIGAFTLASTGLLSGRRATTHYLTIPQFHKQYPDIQVVKNVRFVEDGSIITTGGVTSGIDGALYLVEKLDGPDIAQQVADMLIYNRAAPLPPFTLLPPYYND